MRGRTGMMLGLRRDKSISQTFQEFSGTYHGGLSSVGEDEAKLEVGVQAIRRTIFQNHQTRC